MSSPADFSMLAKAIAFAARAHRHQVRKDTVTPYVSHVFRVAMIVRDRFQVTDPVILAAAVLHDTIEDTPTDYDDLADAFGAPVADIVASLTKVMRLPEVAREEAYCLQLASGGPGTHFCKLADIADNLMDSAHLSPSGQQRTLARSIRYIDAMRPFFSPEVQKASVLVEADCAEVQKRFTT
ncbi:MAG: HD domain-containing protein [Gemmataceae bacterium]